MLNVEILGLRDFLMSKGVEELFFPIARQAHAIINIYKFTNNNRSLVKCSFSFMRMSAIEAEAASARTYLVPVVSRDPTVDVKHIVLGTCAKRRIIHEENWI